MLPIWWLSQIVGGICENVATKYVLHNITASPSIIYMIWVNYWLLEGSPFSTSSLFQINFRVELKVINVVCFIWQCIRGDSSQPGIEAHPGDQERPTFPRWLQKEIQRQMPT